MLTLHATWPVSPISPIPPALVGIVAREQGPINPPSLIMNGRIEEAAYLRAHQSVAVAMADRPGILPLAVHQVDRRRMVHGVSAALQRHLARVHLIGLHGGRNVLARP